MTSFLTQTNFLILKCFLFHYADSAAESTTEMLRVSFCEILSRKVYYNLRITSDYMRLRSKLGLVVGAGYKNKGSSPEFK